MLEFAFFLVLWMLGLVAVGRCGEKLSGEDSIGFYVGLYCFLTIGYFVLTVGGSGGDCGGVPSMYC
jgi:hypothetical protein|tara:strand:+ start:69 stop:266 length:198 start_codon:yes stop_codon:yes gene_type:complete